MKTRELLIYKKVFPIESQEVCNNWTWDTDISEQKAVKPLTLGQLNQLKEDGYNLPAIVCEGDILTVHPYEPQKLVILNTDPIPFLQEKLGHYAIILNYLGATKQTINVFISKLEKRTITAKGKLKVRGKFSLAGAFKRITNKKSSYALSKEVSGTGQLDYETAKKYAEEHGLINDQFVSEILELRHKNPVNHHFLKVDISNDYNDIIDACAKIQVVNAFKIDSSFNSKITNRSTFSIEQDFYFSEQ